MVLPVNLCVKEKNYLLGIRTREPYHTAPESGTEVIYWCVVYVRHVATTGYFADGELLIAFI